MDLKLGEKTMLKHYKKSLLSMSILAVLSNTAFAQENQNDAQADAKAKEQQGAIEVIEVVGTRGSLKRSMNAKRFADQVLDGVSAEDIGKLPDNNIAEALSRVVGVSMNRSDGEGEFVSIRGMDPRLSQVTLNGQSMANSNGKSISSQSSSSRSFNLNNIASEMVAGIEVFKSPTASMVEGSVGGTVNLKTRSPIEVGEKATVTLRGDYNDNSEEFGGGLNLFFNTVNDAETFGFATTVSYFDRETQRNSLESRGWALQKKAPYVNEYNTDGSLKKAGASDTPVWRIEDIRSNFRTDKRERLNINTKIQWLITENLDFNMDVLYSHQERDFISTNWDVDFRDNDKLIVDLDSIVIDGENVVSQVASANSKKGKNFNHEQTGFDRFYDDESVAVNLTLDWFAADGWTITPAMGYSKATGDRDDINPIFSTKVQNLGYSIENGSYSPEIIYPTDPDELAAMNPENLALEVMNYKSWEVEDEQYYAQVDFVRDLDSEVFSSVEFGVRHNVNEKSNRTYQDKIQADIMAANGGTQIVLSDYSNYTVVDGMLSEAPVDAWYVPDFDKIDAEFGHLVEMEEIQRENFEIEETIDAVYLQANINSYLFDIPVRGNIGVRYVETDIESSSYLFLVGQDPERIFADNDYSDTLPSINLAFNLSDEFILRTAAASVMARPDHDDIAPVFRELRAPQNDDGGKYILGNPDLDPYRADQYDLSLEWYFDAEGLLSFGAFYKDIESFITSRTFIAELPGVDGGVPVEITMPINGEGATVEGFEVGLQQAFYMLPEPWDGLGMAANYTYNDSDTELVNNITGENMALPGLSKDTANFMVYYEKYGFSARAAWNYRSSYFNKFSWSQEALYIDDYDQLDIQLGYEFNKQMSLSFEAKNVTGEKSYEYVGNESRMYAVRDNGKAYSLSFKYVM
jgi:iron complex outermembrane receptor protein